MLNIIETYYTRKLKALDKAKDEAIIAVKTTDENYKTLRDLKLNNSKCTSLVTLGEFKFSDTIIAQINDIRAQLKKDVRDLEALCAEANAAVELLAYTSDLNDDVLTSKYKDLIKTLVSFGILNRDGTINA